MNNLDPDLPLEAAYRMNYDDTYSPAVKQGGQLWYWPNITMQQPNHARSRAQESIDNLVVDEDMRQWNVWPDTHDRMD